MLCIGVLISLCSCEIPENHPSKYEVCSVFQYTVPNTNVYGGVNSVDVRYSFTYLDEKSILNSVDDFEHLEYGCTKVCIGESDQYVNDGEYCYLYLSKKTLSRLTGTDE